MPLTVVPGKRQHDPRALEPLSSLLRERAKRNDAAPVEVASDEASEEVHELEARDEREHKKH